MQPWELEPLYLRRPDAEINWVTRDGLVDERTLGGAADRAAAARRGRGWCRRGRRATGLMARPLPTPVDDPGALEVRIAPMRRRHLRGVIRIEQQVYPRPWTFGLFLSEIGQRTTRLYLVARVGAEVVGYAGLFRAVDDGHITTVAVDPAWHRHGIATAHAGGPGPGRRSSAGA